MKAAYRVIVPGLLVCHVALLAMGAVSNSPVVDETAHLAAGISHWQLGTFELFKVNPPLVRMIAALPAIAAGAKTNWRHYLRGPGLRAEFPAADGFVNANGPRVIWLVTVARWGVIPMSLVGAYICYRWSRQLYGELAGVVSLSLWCFSPAILAYGQFIHTDLGATSLGAASNYLFWIWLKRPRWDGAVAAGFALGLAECTKTTWVILFVLWPALWGAWECHARLAFRKRGHGRGAWRTAAAQLALTLALAVLVLNAVYRFEGTGTELGSYRFVSSALTGKTDPQSEDDGNRFLAGYFAAVPIPLPTSYVAGIDMQWHDIERGKLSYLRGRWSTHGGGTGTSTRLL